MRWIPLLVMLALLPGAIPAQAQESPGIIPMPKQPEATAVKKHVRRKAAPVKPTTATAAAKIANLPPVRPASANEATPPANVEGQQADKIVPRLPRARPVMASLSTGIKKDERQAEKIAPPLPPARPVTARISSAATNEERQFEKITPMPPVRPAIANDTTPAKTETKQADKIAPRLPPARPVVASTLTAATKSEDKQAEKTGPPLPPARPVLASLAPPAEAAKTEAATPAPAQVAGIPPSERLKIESALLWAGDYPAESSGEDPLLAAIGNFRMRHKSKVTGPLTSSERADLIAATKDHEDEFGWNVVVDPATGIRIGLPSKLVPLARDAAHGTRWTSAHGEVQIETFRIKESESKLAALFEQEKKASSRKIENSTLREDGFFISGQQGLKRFSVRAKLRDGEVRGFTLLYDQMMETIVERVISAIAAAYSPFPGQRIAPYAALAKSVEYGTGLVVSAQGHIVTDRALTEGCQVLVASGLGDADRIATDDSGLALLRVYRPRKFTPVALTRTAPRGGELTLIGIPDPQEGAGRKLNEVKARLADGSAIELRRPVPMAGFSGAAALDPQGQFLGILQMRRAVLASLDSAGPPVRLINAAAIRAFLAAHNVPLADTPAADAKAAVVRIICVRK